RPRPPSNTFCEGSGVSVWKRLLQSKVGNWFRCGEFVSGARDESGTKREAPQAPLTALSEARTPSLLPLTTPSRMNQIRPSPGEVTAMSRFWQHFLSNGSGTGTPAEPEPSPEENEALDAYSRVVVRVADELRPAVVNLRPARGRAPGSGSGIPVTPGCLLLT